MERRILQRAERIEAKERVLILKTLRATQGWSRAKVAVAAGLTVGQVIARERGDTHLSEQELEFLVEKLGFRIKAITITRRFLAQLEQERKR